jgi:hypothetical protein
MKINKQLSKNKPYYAWICDVCGSVTPVDKALFEPECEYCRRVRESE